MTAILPIIILICLLVPVFLISKFMLIKSYREKYELSLINGDEETAKRIGLLYYHMLSSEVKRQKGITEIGDKITEEFKAHNS